MHPEVVSFSSLRLRPSHQAEDMGARTSCFGWIPSISVMPLIRLTPPFWMPALPGRTVILERGYASRTQGSVA
jgi:hypothetical protein